MQTTKKILYKELKKSSKLAKENKSTLNSIGAGEFKTISINDLDASPLNYRRSFPMKELEELASDIRQHGIISNLVVRRSGSEKYELVTGERRFRAAKMAGLKELPVNIKTLSDQEVIEIQLSENLQRSDTHPMEEAFAIERLQKVYSNMDEIALRLGKSRAFVYKRLKLVSLIDPIRELFLANKCTVQQAYDIALLSSDSQTDFYEEYCSDWQTKEDFEFPDSRYTLERFRYDLTEAPFDIKDEKLIPEKGACSSCPFNSATVGNLFPDHAKEAVCSNKECYKQKCTVSFGIKIQRLFEDEKPEALLFHGSSEKREELIRMIPQIATIPQFNYYRVDILNKPVPPSREDYIDEDEQSDYDEDLFKDALEEYENDLNEFEQAIDSRKYRKGLLVAERNFSIVLFNPEERLSDSPRTGLPKAVEVQSAIKSGTATVELLQGEINRIHAREERSSELDREKVQVLVQERFREGLSNLTGSPSSADYVAIRLILFQSLDYSARNTVLQKLFMENEKFSHWDNEELYSHLENLSEDQFAYLIRIAMVSKSDSKNPKSETGYFLYKMAEQSGLKLDDIENGQKDKTDKRQANQLVKISMLKKQIEKIKP